MRSMAFNAWYGESQNEPLSLVMAIRDRSTSSKGSSARVGQIKYGSLISRMSRRIGFVYVAFVIDVFSRMIVVEGGDVDEYRSDARCVGSSALGSKSKRISDSSLR